MPNLNVCTGKAFTTGSSGELLIAGSGSKSWTLSGPIAANNGLNTDPVNGLWTAPHGCYSQFSRQQQTGLSATVNSTTTYPIPSSAFTWTNPSAAQQARLFAWCYARVDCSVNANTILQMNVGANLGAGSNGPAAGFVNIPNPTASAISNVTGAGSTVNEVLVAPSGVASLSFTPSVSWLGGTSGTVLQWFLDVAFLAILLDPTQSGGIS